MTPRFKWWAVAACLAAAHLIALFSVCVSCSDSTVDDPCPLETVGIVLANPAWFLFGPVLGAGYIILWPLNSLLWGCVLAEPIRWWFGWPPWRFSLRQLLTATALIVLLLGIRAFSI
jgi:hypothetical protein